MKKMRKIASLLLALAMVFGLTATAFAAEVEKVTEVDNLTGHNYAAYQVFKGTQQESVGEGDTTITALGDIDWGKGVSGSTLLTALIGLTVEEDTPFADCENAADVAAVLDKKGNDSAIAKAFANAADKHRTDEYTVIPANETSIKLETGYYLLVDTGKTKPDGTPDDTDAYNSALLQVTNRKITIRPKYSVPQVEKKVEDKDGSLGDAAECTVGDSVNFVLTGTVPVNLDDYDSYTYEFLDTLSVGLQYNGDAEVYLAIRKDDGTLENETEITSGFTVTPGTASNTGGGTLKVAFADLKGVDGIDASITEGSVIVIEVKYSATLTKEAVAGSAGNRNKVELTYSNNPNKGGEGSTDTTPPDEVIVFTFKLDGTKIDGQTPDKKLEGARFILYRVKEGETEPSYTEVDGKKIPTNVQYAKISNGKLTGWIDIQNGDSQAAYEAAKADSNLWESNDAGKFELSGLGKGVYYLEETKAPAGYNLLKDPVKLTIDPKITEGTTGPSVTELNIITKDEDDKDVTTLSGDEDRNNGTVRLQVKNNMGALLPSTGGMGTTLFYIAGAALILAAGVLFMMKRRTSAGK